MFPSHAFLSDKVESLGFKGINKIKLHFCLLIEKIFSNLSLTLAKQSFKINSISHPQVLIGTNARCINASDKENIQISEGCVIRGILRAGEYQVQKSGRIKLAPHVYIGDDSKLSSIESIEIGEWTLISHNVHIFDNDSHPNDPQLRQQDWAIIKGIEGGPRAHIASKAVKIGSNVLIGMNSIILKGVEIGEGSVIAPGSLVTTNVPPFSLVMGNPSQIVKNLKN
jgi:acetyltransferase-like isoleucine patch superfamily enzyme